MVFSGLLSSADRPVPQRWKSSPASSSEAAADGLGSPYISHEAQLSSVPPPRPDLRELNNSLEALAAVFPDIQLEVFRELLSHFDGQSRLELVADALLKNRVGWVKGRWRSLDQQQKPSPAAAADGGLPPGEGFRSPDYIKAVRSLAWQEFKGLSRSTVDAVLAESNHSYLDARRTLVALSSKSWRFAISSLFLRRRPVVSSEAEGHPLVSWRPSGHGSLVPAIRSTGNPELDRELYEALIRPLQRRDQETREAADHQLAVLLNQEEAEAAGAVYECACCFSTLPFDDFTHCSRQGHMVCFRCVHHSLKEALFGQAWRGSIDTEKGTLRCLAVVGGGDGCPGHLPSDQLQRALSLVPDGSGPDLALRLDQRLAEHSLAAAKLPLVHCPFCSYAEVDEVYLPSSESRLRLQLGGLCGLLLVLGCLVAALLLLPLGLLSSLACLAAGSGGGRPWAWAGREWQQALGRLRRRRRGLRFACGGARCQRVSCLACHKPWTDIHVCHESSLVALRTQVETAMSMAVKRVCPRCKTSFVKHAGCNKLTCPCGYRMCYVCRADLSIEGYRHFCDHFRPDGDPRPCRDCDRCNLWQSEDLDQVLRQARLEAERHWRQAEQRDLSAPERAYLETGIAASRPGASPVLARLVAALDRRPTVASLLDAILDSALS